jgi:hypothetical protein
MRMCASCTARWRPRTCASSARNAAAAGTRTACGHSPDATPRSWWSISALRPPAAPCQRRLARQLDLPTGPGVRGPGARRAVPGGCDAHATTSRACGPVLQRTPTWATSRRSGSLKCQLPHSNSDIGHMDDLGPSRTPGAGDEARRPDASLANRVHSFRSLRLLEQIARSRAGTHVDEACPCPGFALRRPRRRKRGSKVPVSIFANGPRARLPHRDSDPRHRAAIGHQLPLAETNLVTASDCLPPITFTR